MADDLVFKVKFDLQKGVDEALKDGGKALDRIEKVLGKHPITIKLRMDNRVARGASAELTGFKKQLAELTQQWNSLTAAERGSAAGAAIREKFRALRTEAQGYTSTLQAAVKAEDKMRESHSKTAASANKLSSAYHNQSTYLSRLIQSMAAYAGVSYVGNFLTNVREVTAQFELQRISLGAIIQDQARANQLFEEIKTFALKSPVKILDLTKYTKQLAAYKIGVDELFDTTKRLTDISQGLGVSMERIVLMYGQIRATGYLRASEVRQATEAGIPLVEELAKKLSKANGELVTAADVMDMISKRTISFDMVKEVFDDMTSAGGIFYNMQEKQGNTLFGMWQKLGDAAAVMYDQIGNTSRVNEGMKMAIQTLRYLMLHWKQVGIVVGGVSVYILANTIATKNNAIATAAATTANKLHIASLQQKLGALRLEQMNLKSTAIFQRLHTAATISATKAQIGAATSTNVFSKALYGLKAALLSNPLTALAVALTTIMALLMQSESELDKLNSKLQDIDRDYDASGKKSVDRFKELVRAVEENVDGSKAQKEALDELDRTYSKILGSEALELDSLKALGGQYGELIDMIDAYNAKKKGEERETAIKSSYATILDEEKDDLMDYLNQAGMSAEKQAEFIQAINDKMLEGKDYITATDEVFKEFANDISQLASAGNVINVLNFDKLADAWGVGFRQLGGLFGGQGMDYLYNYARALEGQNKALEDNEKQTRLAADAMGVYSTSVDGLNKSFANLDWSSMEALYNSLQDYNAKHPENMISVPINMEFDPTKAQSEYEKMLEMGNMQIHAIFSNLQTIASQEGVAIPEEFYKQAKSVVDGNKSFSFIDFDGIIKLFDSPKAKAAIRESKTLYEGISPNDKTAAVFRTKLAQLASASGVELSTMTKYFMKAGDKIEDYAKRIKEAIEDLEKKLKEMQTTNQMVAEGGHGPLQGFSEEEIKKIQMQVAVLKELFPFLQGFTKSSGSGRQSDPRLQNLKEEISLTKKLYDEYHKLEKQIGATQAKAKIQEIYSNTIKTLQDRAGKYGFTFELPFTDENLKANMQHFIDKMKELQGLKDKKGKPLFPNIGKEIDEAVAQLEDVDLNSLQKALEKKLKELSDRISRTKTAKEFYEKILEQTGDINIATRVSMSVYGSTGEELFIDTVEQIREAFKTGSEEHPIDLDISAAIDLENQRIDYKKLADIYDKYQDEIIEKRRDTAKKIATEGQKEVATDILNWRKSLAKAKSYEQKRTDIINTATAERAKIIRETTDPKERGELLGLSYSKQAQELAKLAVDEFKSSDDYIKVFQDLDRVSTQTLDRMKKRLEEMIATVKDTENVEGLKTLVEQLDKIKEERETRNPIEGIIDSFKEYAKARKDYRTAEAEEAAAKAEFAQQEVGLNMAIQTAKSEQAAAQQRVNDLKAQGKENTAEGVAAELALNEATKKVTQATENRNKAVKKVNNAEQKTTDALDAQKAALAKLQENVNAMANAFSSAASSIKTIADMMGIAEDSELGDIVNGLVDGLNNAATIMTTILAIAIAIEAACWWMLAIGAAVAAFSAIGSWLTGSKVRKANKEIERQQKLLDQLEYTYGRLEKAAERAFGSDYISNYNQRMRVLRAEQEAYLKQAEAERSKGKKEDEAKTQEYMNRARDAADQIAEMQSQIAEQMTGTDVGSAAREFAQAWLEAYASFSSTSSALKEKFDDMIKSMVVESVMAKVVSDAMQPMFDEMNEMYKRGESMTSVLAYAMRRSSELASELDAGLRTAAAEVEAAGVSIRGLYSGGDGLKGKSRDIATASEESIMGLAQGVSTQNYYLSHVPQLAQNVAAMRTMMEAAVVRGGGAGVNGVDYTGLSAEAMGHLAAIERHTAETVAECRNIAARCEEEVGLLRRVIVPKGQRGAHGVQVWM